MVGVLSHGKSPILCISFGDLTPLVQWFAAQLQNPHLLQEVPSCPIGTWSTGCPHDDALQPPLQCAMLSKYPPDKMEVPPEQTRQMHGLREGDEAP